MEGGDCGGEGSKEGGVVKVKQELLSILQHSLGLDRYGQGESYRNHFVAGFDDVEKCRELVTMGLMVERRPTELTGGDPCFVVTEAGKFAVVEESEEPPKITRGKRNYLAFLASDTEQTFLEFLRDPFWKDFRRNFYPKYY